MAVWGTAAEIGRRYVVGEEGLLAYGRRGNLPMRRLASGQTFFDEVAVARLFRARGASGEFVLARLGPAPTNLGVLGTSKLGRDSTRQPRDAMPLEKHALAS